jgi:hypothetical protein
MNAAKAATTGGTMATRKQAAATRKTAKKAAKKAAKKTAGKTSAKRAATKKATAKKAAPKKTTAKKTVAKKTVAKKAAPKKTAAKKTVAKKAAPKKTAAKKTATKKTAPRKTTAKQALANTRKLLRRKQAQARETKPWEALDGRHGKTPQPGFQSDEARVQAESLHEAEMRLEGNQGSISTHDRHNQGKRDSR